MHMIKFHLIMREGERERADYVQKSETIKQENRKSASVDDGFTIIKVSTFPEINSGDLFINKEPTSTRSLGNCSCQQQQHSNVL